MSADIKGDIGVALWVLSLLAFIILVLQQYSRYQNSLPFSWQPLQGERNLAAPANVPKLYWPLFVQFLLFSGLLTSLSLNHWADIGRYSKLGLLTYSSSSPSESTVSRLSCTLRYDYYLRSSYYYFTVTESTIGGTGCISLVGGSIVVFCCSLVSLVLSLYQFAMMQTWIDFRKNVVPAGRQFEITNAVVPGIYVRNYIQLAMHCMMALIYGVSALVSSGASPAVSFWIILGLVFFSRVQYYLIESYIRLLPSPRPDRLPGYPQCASVAAAASLQGAGAGMMPHPTAAVAWNPPLVEMGAINPQHAPPIGYTPAYLPQYGSPQYGSPQWAAANAFPFHPYAPSQAMVPHPPGEGAPAFFPPRAYGVSAPPGSAPVISSPSAQHRASPAAVGLASAGDGAAAAGATAALTATVAVCPSCNSNERQGALFCSSCGGRM